MYKINEFMISKTGVKDYSKLLKNQFFPLHDQRELLGMDTNVLFKEVIQLKDIYSRIPVFRMKATVTKNVPEEEPKRSGLQSINEQIILNVPKEATPKSKKSEPKNEKRNEGPTSTPRFLKSQYSFEEQNVVVPEEISKIYEIDEEDLDKRISKCLNFNGDLRTELHFVFKNRKSTELVKDLMPETKYPLNQSFTVNLFRPGNYSSESVETYFGQKIAMYFTFSSFFSKRLGIPSLIGIVIVSLIYISRYVPNSFTLTILRVLFVLFAVFISVWNSLFSTAWLKTEQVMKAGNPFQDEANKTLRRDFEGEFCRSMDDRMNDRREDEVKVWLKRFLNWIVLVGFIVCSTITSYWILYAKRYSFYKKGIPFEGNLIALEHSVFDLSEIVRILLFNKVFEFIYVKLVDFMDLKFEEDHEDELVIGLSIFRFYNGSISILLIVILDLLEDLYTVRSQQENNYLKCMRDNCFEELSIYMTTYSVYELIRTLVEGYLFLGLMKKLMQTFSRSKRSYAKDPVAEGKEIFLSQTGDEAEKAKLLIHTFYKSPDSIYYALNKEIEDQILFKDNYKLGHSYDLIFNDYLEIVSSYQLLSCFGLMFPLSFLLISLANFWNTSINRNLLLKSTKRPVPRSCQGLRLWTKILQFVPLLSILTNSFFIGFTVLQNLEITQSFAVFLGSAAGLFAINYLTTTQKKLVPRNSELIHQRDANMELRLFKMKNSELAAHVKKMRPKHDFTIYGKSDMVRRGGNK